MELREQADKVALVEMEQALLITEEVEAEEQVLWDKTVVVQKVGMVGQVLQTLFLVLPLPILEAVVQVVPRKVHLLEVVPMVVVTVQQLLVQMERLIVEAAEEVE
jgi:hypothetical protein